MKVNMPQAAEHILDALCLFYSDDLQWNTAFHIKARPQTNPKIDHGKRKKHRDIILNPDDSRTIKWWTDSISPGNLMLPG